MNEFLEPITFIPAYVTVLVAPVMTFYEEHIIQLSLVPLI